MLELWHREFVDAPAPVPRPLSGGSRRSERCLAWNLASSSSRPSATRRRTSSASCARVAAQELPPARWIVVDDALRRRHARDPAPARAGAAVPDRGRARRAPRRAGARPARARCRAADLQRGPRAAGDWREYTHVMKLDGDIELKPAYLRELIGALRGRAGARARGRRARRAAAGGGMRRIQIAARPRPRSAQAATRASASRRSAASQERLGWDTIDETYARMRGFTTCSFTGPRVASTIARWAAPTARSAATPATASAPTSRTSRRPGSRCARSRSARAARRVLSGLAFFYGFARAAARRVERVPDPEYRRFTRRELRRRMLGALVPRYQGAP